MERTISNYYSDAERTLSGIYRPDMASRYVLLAALRAAKEAGEAARDLKRAVFGGKGEPVSHRDIIEFGALQPQMLHALLGIINETGEIATRMLDILFVYHGRVTSDDLANLDEEIGDLFWFAIFCYCKGRGIDPRTIMDRNIAKLKARFPEKFDADKLLDENRDKAAETAALKGENMSEI